MAAAAGGSAAYAAYASLAVGAIGTVASIAAAQQQAESQANALKYQAQVAANNKIQADALAQRATEAGESQVDTKRLQTANVIGGQLAAQSASGLDVNSGTAVDVRSSAAEMGELDALTIRNNAAMTSYGYKTQGINYAAQAGLDAASSQNALTAGSLNEFSSLAGGASSLSDKWLKFQNAGLLSGGRSGEGNV